MTRALETLAAQRIPVGPDPDGQRGRKLVFDTDTGDACVKAI